MKENKHSEEKLKTEKVNEMVTTGNNVLKVLYFILVLLIIYVISLVAKEWGILKFLFKILSIISPLFWGFLIAWLLNPLVTRFNDKGMSRTIATITVYIILIVAIYLLSLAIFPSLGDQVNDLIGSLPTILGDLKEWVENIFINISNKSLINLDNVKNELFLSIEEFGQDITTNLPKVMIGFIQSIASGLGTIILSFIVGFYMLFNFPNLKVGFMNILPKSVKKDTEKIIDLMSVTILEYVKGTLLIAMILFLVSYIGFTIIGLKAPALFALFCAITDLIPYIGPYIGGAAAVIVGFTQGSVTGIVTLIFIIVCQALESYILQPLVMSKKTNLHPVTILIGLLIFGSFFGIIGMILATPIMAIIKILYVFLDEKYGFFEYKENKQNKKRLKENK